jgi:hypothetical protein
MKKNLIVICILLAGCAARKKSHVVAGVAYHGLRPETLPEVTTPSPWQHFTPAARPPAHDAAPPAPVVKTPEEPAGTGSADTGQEAVAAPAPAAEPAPVIAEQPRPQPPETAWPSKLRPRLLRRPPNPRRRARQDFR